MFVAKHGLRDGDRFGLVDDWLHRTLLR